MKSDLINFLKETGRPPSTTMQEHLEEIKENNQLREECKYM